MLNGMNWRRNRGEHHQRRSSEKAVGEHDAVPIRRLDGGVTQPDDMLQPIRAASPHLMKSPTRISLSNSSAMPLAMFPIMSCSARLRHGSGDGEGGEEAGHIDAEAVEKIEYDREVAGSPRPFRRRTVVRVSSRRRSRRRMPATTCTAASSIRAAATCLRQHARSDASTMRRKPPPRAPARGTGNPNAPRNRPRLRGRGFHKMAERCGQRQCDPWQHVFHGMLLILPMDAYREFAKGRFGDGAVPISWLLTSEFTVGQTAVIEAGCLSDATFWPSMQPWRRRASYRRPATRPAAKHPAARSSGRGRRAAGQAFRDGTGLVSGKDDTSVARPG